MPLSRAVARLATMASNRKERLALNEGLFRTANERMAGWEERHGPEEV